MWCLLQRLMKAAMTSLLKTDWVYSNVSFKDSWSLQWCFLKDSWKLPWHFLWRALESPVMSWKTCWIWSRVSFDVCLDSLWSSCHSLPTAGFRSMSHHIQLVSHFQCNLLRLEPTTFFFNCVCVVYLWVCASVCLPGGEGEDTECPALSVSTLVFLRWGPHWTWS